MRPSSSFFEVEKSLKEAHRRAVAKKGFWVMVWSGNGVTYTELMQMDLAEYSECCEAKRLWLTEWKQKQPSR